MSPLLAVLPLAALAASGTASLSSDTFTVRRKVGFQWIYTVGPEGFAPGDQLRLRDPVLHGMRWSRWGDFSPYRELCEGIRSDQRASFGYVTAYVERDGARLEDAVVEVERTNCSESADGTPSCARDLHRDTWTVLTLASAEPLEEGDRIHLVVGDVEGCHDACEAAGEADCSYCDDCGFQTPSRSFEHLEWTARECLGGTCEELPPVAFTFTAEPQVARVLVTAPSIVVAGEPFTMKVTLLDELGNAVPSDPRTLTVDLEGAAGAGDGQSWTLTEQDGGWHDFELRLDEPGVYRIAVRAGDEEVRSNPVEVVAEEPEVRVWWGDIHVHHGYGWTDEDGVLHEANQEYARDVVNLDVTCEAAKAEGVEIDADSLWAELQENCVSFTEEGEYLDLLGFEWMGDIVAEKYGIESQGHHNVYYDACDGPYGTHDVDAIDSVDGERGLWAWLEAVEAETGVHAVTVPHAMRYTGYDYGISNPGVQTLAEIWSEWGDETTWDGDDPSGSVVDLLASGLHLGWIGASDNHDGWMGNPFSNKNVESGLAAFLAPALTRADVFDAMKRRRAYATSGIRPVLHFDAVDGGERYPMGTILLADAPTFEWRVYAEAPISRLRVLAVVEGVTEEIVAHDEAPGTLDAEGSLRPSWDGRTTAWWLEVVQEDGEKAWSSPIWLTGDCGLLADGAVDPLGRCEGDTAGPDTAAPSADTAGSGNGGPPPRRCACASGPRGGGWAALFAACAVAFRGRRRRRSGKVESR